MNAAKETTRHAEELAAHWTDRALQILRGEGLRPLSVHAELRAWRALAAVLRDELRWQRVFRAATLVSLTSLREHVLWKAVAGLLRHALDGHVSSDSRARIRQAAAQRGSTPAEVDAYRALIAEPAARASFKAPTRSDFTPHLRFARTRF